jgi:ubiquinone/menaquinone biosynthesis C-methylase UbiE
MNVNQMHPLRWIPATTSRLLDVGCNVGELLCECRNLYPHIELSGVDINPVAVQEAIRRLPGSAIYASSGHTLPFEDSRFDCVTCIEVLEHMDFHVRTMTAREIARVTRPGGRLVVRCPHTPLCQYD